MHKHRCSMAIRGLVLLTVAAVATACASKHDTRGPFVRTAPFSKTVPGSGDAVCWSVKRALLGQGYMLERSSESGVLTGTRDSQPEDKVNVTVRLQTSCADNRNGTSIVFVTAMREESQLQKMKQSTSLGVGPATLTMPSGSAEVLGTVRRATVRDPVFYDQFFALVQNFVSQESVATAAAAAATAPEAHRQQRPTQHIPASASASQSGERD